jgi:tight adherence protein C
MDENLLLMIIVSVIFAAVVVVTMVLGSAILRRERIRSRLAVGVVATSDVSGNPSRKLLDRIDDKLVGFDAENRSKLRFEMLRGGYFSVDAPKAFLVTRAVTIFALPFLGYILSSFFVSTVTTAHQLLLVAFLLYLGYAGPQAYLKRRQGYLLQSYRNIFPDFLDILVVCLDAGLSFEAALVRIGREFEGRCPEYAMNLALLGSEIRTGRGTIEALDNLADRLGLDEAKSFAVLLKQSIELGSDIGDGLRSYADDMRDKRMARAETKAAELPVKLTIPLGLFIFPVILILALAPAVIRLASAFKAFGGG